eukprot:793165-Prorocentrum_lima.AAC.1
MTVRIGRGSAVRVLAGIGLGISGASDAISITRPQGTPGNSFPLIVNDFCKVEPNALKRSLRD